MNSFIISIKDCLAHPLTIIALILIFLIYSFASKKIKRLPKLPLSLFVVYLILKFIKTSLPFLVEDRYFLWLDIATVAVFYFAIIRLLFSLIIENIFYMKKAVPFPKITRDFILIILYAIVTFTLLRSKANFNLAGLITTSAVLTASIGFAAQNTLSNLFSGLSIQMDRPFVVGDWITISGYTGQVVGIGWKSTRIKTFENEIIVIPNLSITRNEIRNYSKLKRKHIMSIEIGVEYNAKPGKVREVLLEICKNEPSILSTFTPEVRLISYGDFSILYELRFAYLGYGQHPRLKAKITEKIWYAFARNKIHIPFPIRDIQFKHIERNFENVVLENRLKSARRALENIKLFDGLAEQEKDLLSKDLIFQPFAKGEKIVVQDSPGQSAYILHRGNCDVVLEGPEGQHKVASLQGGAIFGEMSLLTGEPRTATVIANSDCHLIKINKDAFAKIIQKNPSISEALADMLLERQGMLNAIKKAGLTQETGKSQILNKIKSFFKIS